jgi:DNA mismatch repair protein MutS2
MESSKQAENQDEISLGFDQIRELIAAECIGEPAREEARKLRFLTNYALVIHLQEENEEYRKLIGEGIQIPEQHFINLEPITRHLDVEGFVPDKAAWINLNHALLNADSIARTLKRHMARFPRLYALGQTVEIPSEILYRFSEVFATDGEILDSASPELNRLRKKKIDEQSKLRRKLESALRTAVSSSYSADDAGITIRNGRLVIPVFAEHKRRIRGFVHDESATGQTVYIEPEEALEANNTIRELHFAENREIQRILLELSESVRPHKAKIEQAGNLLTKIDLIRARTRFGMKIGACLPSHHQKPAFLLFEARHPLLLLSHKKKGLPLIPLNIWLTEEKRMLVISGPNAGGKSVCLKTVGLIQLMWQAGIPVSVGEGSKMGFFNRIFADIGDQQSLENDLSTYSSHLSNMRRILASANEQSLVLLDEFGNGTDPALGGPIAEAILEALCHRKSYGLVNTHYSNLKIFAGRNPICENGAMKFNADKMEPLFQLEIGKPGSSFALEIAEKTGLPRPVLNQARNKIGTKKINVDRLLSDLEREKQELDQKLKELRDREKAAKLLQSELEAKNQKLETEKRNILNKARSEAATLFETANRKIEETIRSIRENQAEKNITRNLRLELAELKENLQPEEVEAEKPEVKTAGQKKEEIPTEVLKGEIKPGDFVRIRGSESAGKVISLRGKNVEVEIGEIRSSIKSEKLEKISHLPASPNKKNQQGINLGEKMMEFSTQLDIRGKRADEALREVEFWLDEAMLLGQKDLRILHGKGNGILRMQVRNFLKVFPQISDIRDEHADQGGAGITLFSIRN